MRAKRRIIMENERTGIIYKATSPSGRVYVRKTVSSLAKRKSKHRVDAKKHTYAFANAINKYGIEGFTWDTIESKIPYCKLNEKEIFYVSKFDSYKSGYNSTEGGDYNPMDYEENRIKLSIRKLGVPLDIDQTGEKNHQSKLTWSDIYAIRDEYKNTSLTHDDLGVKYNISRKSIGNVINNITWIDDKYVPIIINKQSKLTINKVNEIRKKYSKGIYTLELLGKEYDVCFQLISSIINNKIWVDSSYKVPDVKSIKKFIKSNRDKEICSKYITGNYTNKCLAEEYKLGVSTINRIISKVRG